MLFWRLLKPGESLGAEIAGTWNYGLVFMSFLVAVTASFCAFEIVDRMTESPKRRARYLWLIGGAFAMGSGIWAMHFVGMLAFRLPVAMAYDLVITLVSILPAFFASAIALTYLSQSKQDIVRLNVASLLMASGIGAMHYVGMEAMQMNATLAYNLFLFVLSILVAHALALVALLIRYLLGRGRFFSGWSGKAASSVVMGGAVGCMHYTAMAAARFYPSAETRQLSMRFEPMALALTAGSVCALIIAIAFVATYLGRRINTLSISLMDSEDTLRKSEARIANIVESMLDGVITIDEDGIVNSFNPAAARIFGFEADEVIGHNFKMLLPESYHSELGGFVSNHLQTEDQRIAGTVREVVGRRKDGSVFPMDLAISGMPLENEKGLVGVVRDITQRKQADRQIRERNKLLALGADVGTALTQANEIIPTLERAAQATVDHLEAAFARIWLLNESEQVLELKASAGMYTHIDGPHGRVPVGKFKIGLIAEERAPHLTNNVPTDPRVGDQDWAKREGLVSFAGYPLMVGDRLVGVMAMFAKHPLADATLDALGSVASQIALGINRMQTLEELRLAKDAAEHANQSKSAFLANMSHELRTPLNAIIGYSEMLEEEVVDLEQEALVPDLKRIHSAGKHLLELINDILDLSKIESGKMELYCEQFELDKALEEICETSRPLIEKNGNILQTEFAATDWTMYSDRTKIRQCLFNLISNAAKFTENGTITFQAETRSEEDNRIVVFSVRDTGIGMSDEQCAKIFESFTQADSSTTRKFGGTGLGLTITKRICEMMNGEILVDSVAGEGTTFTIRLPLRLAEGATVQAPGHPDHDQPAATTAVLKNDDRPIVLVIDDDPAARDLIARHLINEGFHAVLAASGEEGLRLAREVVPDIITLDVMMPGMDGWEILNKLKEDEELAQIPVIMVSMLNDKEFGVAVGASDYLVKPVEKERLLRTIHRFHSSPTDGDCVLIVEDDHDTRNLMVAMLKKEGYTVVEAENGKVALDRLRNTIPSVILLDLMMPEMDGFTLLGELQQTAALAAIPVIILTAKDLTQADRERLNGHIDTVLSKGTADRRTILESINSALQQSAKS